MRVTGAIMFSGHRVCHVIINMMSKTSRQHKCQAARWSFTMSWSLLYITNYDNLSGRIMEKNYHFMYEKSKVSYTMTSIFSKTFLASVLLSCAVSILDLLCRSILMYSCVLHNFSGLLVFKRLKKLNHSPYVLVWTDIDGNCNLFGAWRNKTTQQ